MFDIYFKTISIRRHKLVSGELVYTANVYAKDELRPQNLEKNLLYADCDGSGTSTYKSEAIYKAVSEGIERIAFYQNFKSSEYGFAEYCSTSGMAAYPGLFKSYSRKLAYNEAAERWCISKFWNSEMGIDQLSSEDEERIFRLRTPFSASVLIIDREIEKNGQKLRAFGFAAGNSFKGTLFKSRVELDRNLEAISSLEDIADYKLNLLERRLIFFSQDEGSTLFDSRIKSALTIKGTPTKPNIVRDVEIRGPWSDSCTVHRVVFDGLTENDVLEDFSF